MVWTQLPTFTVGCFTRYSPIPRSIAYKRARRQSVFQLSSYMGTSYFFVKITLPGHMRRVRDTNSGAYTNQETPKKRGFPLMIFLKNCLGRLLKPIIGK